MATGEGMLERARQHIGEPYENVTVPKNNPNWRGPWDCAEFMSWLVYQEGGFLYGCTNDHAPPALAEAYTGGWQHDSSVLGRRVTIDEAASTVGGIVLRYPPAPGKMGHIAICDGKGGTVEAKGHAYGVVADTVQNRAWNTGVLLPNFQYAPPTKRITWIAPKKLYALNAPNMIATTVEAIQRALAAAKLDPGPIDGVFGPNTVAAVAAFQRLKGLVVDGAVGPDTAAALGVTLK